MNYETSSDFEINKEVAKTLGYEIVEPFQKGLFMIQREVSEGYGSRTRTEAMPDYCNDPSGAWPIIESIWDTLMFVPKDDLLTVWENALIEYDTDNKLRAAMVVYLKAKGVDSE